MDNEISLDPLASVDLGTYTIDGNTGIDETVYASSDASSDLTTTTTPFNWSAVASGITNLLTSWSKVAIAGQAEKNALPGQVVGAQVQIAQTQAQQSTNMMIGIGIIGAVALISIIVLSK
jgi:hypothetical protein